MFDNDKNNQPAGGASPAFEGSAPDYWGADGRCTHCGAGNDAHHSYTCPTNMHPDKREPDEKKVASDALLSALRGRLYPNCTLYLIWHYLQQGDVEAARAEYARDSDKLGVNRKLVESILVDNASLDRTAASAGTVGGVVLP